MYHMLVYLDDQLVVVVDVDEGVIVDLDDQLASGGPPGADVDTL